MPDAGDFRAERAEQFGVELVRQADVECVGRALPVLERRDGLAQGIDLLGELLAGRLQLRRPRRSGRDEEGVAMVADDRHPVIAFAVAQRLLQVGERHHLARDGAVAREAGERRLARGLLALRFPDRGAERARPDHLLGSEPRTVLEPSERDSRTLDLAGQGDRLAEQARRLARASAELAGQHSLRLRKPRPDHQLRRREDFRGRRRIAPRQQDVDIGTKHLGERGRQVAGVRLRMDDVAEHRFGRRHVAAAREIAREPRPRVQQRGGIGIARLEHRDALPVQPVGLGSITRFFGDRGEVAEDLRAHPDDRHDLSATHGGKRRVGIVERLGRAAPVARQAQRRPAQLQRLAIEDGDLLLREELVRRGSELFAELAVGVQPLGCRRADPEGAGLARGRARRTPRKSLAQLRERILRPALVEKMHGAVVAQPPGDDRVAADRLVGPGEQGIGFGVASQVRLLQRLVGEALCAADGSFARAAHRGEEFGGLGIASGVVAAVGLGQRTGGVHRACLHPSESRGIAHSGRGDRHFALDGLVGDDAP